MPCSLITIAFRRNRHLNNLLKGLAANEQLPEEVIIVDINSTVSLEDNYGLSLKLVKVEKTSDLIPLAQARNAGANAASHDNLLFLDVDCIPSKSFVGGLCDQLEKVGGLIMASPRYLEEPVATDFSERELWSKSMFHPNREEVSQLKRSEVYENFWSLCFGISKDNFEKIGGFDTSFKGYGGEDTDFAFTARELKIAFYQSEIVVFHQQHTVFSPPLNYLFDIVVNSNSFHRKWGVWPMEGWLQAFKDLHVIDWEKGQNEKISRIAAPTPEMLDDHKYENAPFA